MPRVGGSLVAGGGLSVAASASTLDLRALLLPLVPSLVWALLALVPSLALVVRRRHGTSRSGWWYLLVLPCLASTVLQLVTLASLDERRLAGGDPGGLALGPLLGGLVLGLVGIVGGIVLLVPQPGPDPRGGRFDRRG